MISSGSTHNKFTLLCFKKCRTTLIPCSTNNREDDPCVISREEPLDHGDAAASQHVVGALLNIHRCTHQIDNIGYSKRTALGVRRSNSNDSDKYGTWFKHQCVSTKYMNIRAWLIERKTSTGGDRHGCSRGGQHRRALISISWLK